MRPWAFLPGMLFAGILIGTGLGCTPEPSEVVLDLAAEWDQAAVATEAARIDIGTEQARQHLERGWHYDERNRHTGDTFVWSRGEFSELVFHLGWKRDLEVEITGHPFQYPGAAGQTLSFELNGRVVKEGVSPPPEHGGFTIRLPVDTQEVGANTLTVRYGRVESPAAAIVGATDERPLAYAWSEIRIRDVDDSVAKADRGILTLPAGSRIDTFVELAAGSELRIDACEPMGENSPVIKVGFRGEHDTDEVLSVFQCGSTAIRLSTGDRVGLTRLRLSIVPSGADEPPSSVQIRGARVLSPSTGAGETPPTIIPGGTSVVVGPRPNVVVYLVDALRSDRLGPYGCDRGLSPRLDAMAAEGITFTDVTAQSSWTKAAVASIFTGIWPREHGVNGPDDRLPEDLPTLPERLHEAGYRTGAVVANAYVGRPFGFARGFDHFEYLEHGKGRSRAIGERVERWLNSLEEDDAPFFLYVHTIDPHAPYAPPERFRRAFAPDVEDPTVGRVDIVRGIVLGDVEPTDELADDLRNLYDGEVAANDASFGRLLDHLEAIGELENTLVIFTSDHGEAFGEHGTWTHGLDLHNEVLAVPLVMRLPGGAGAGHRVREPVQHIDLLPTILAVCGVNGGTMAGSRLVTSSGAAPVEAGRTILAYLDYWDRHGASIMRDGWKLIEPLSEDFGPAPMLYRHDLDPAETRDLAAASPVRKGWLGARLGGALRHRAAGQPIEVSPEVREQLEALGYMQ